MTLPNGGMVRVPDCTAELSIGSVSFHSGTPMFIIIVWSVAKYLQEDEGCVHTDQNINKI